MWSNHSVLKLSEELGRMYPDTTFEEGMKIARGFADLGYEEFLLLPGGKLLALYSGQVTQFPEEHRRFFFEVPTPDQVAARLNKAFWDIRSLQLEDQRTWMLTIVNAKTGAVLTFSADLLEECFLHAAVGISPGKIS